MIDAEVAGWACEQRDAEVAEDEIEKLDMFISVLIRKNGDVNRYLYFARYYCQVAQDIY